MLDYNEIIHVEKYHSCSKNDSAFQLYHFKIIRTTTREPIFYSLDNTGYKNIHTQKF